MIFKEKEIVRISNDITITTRRFSSNDVMKKMQGTVQTINSIDISENKIWIMGFVWDPKDIKALTKPLPNPSPQTFNPDELVFDGE